MSASAIVLQPDSPVALSNCLVDTRSSRFGNRDYWLDAGVTETNTSQRALTAVRIRLDVFDSFGAHVRTVYGDDQNPPGVGSFTTTSHNEAAEQRSRFYHQTDPELLTVYLPRWEYINITPTATKYVCSVDKVAFFDGTVWAAKPLAPGDLANAAATATKPIGLFYTESGP